MKAAAKNYRVWVLLPALILGFFSQSTSGFCHSDSDVKLMDKFQKKFLEHYKAFTYIAKASRGQELEYEIAIDFINLCESYADNTDFISEELIIAEMVENKIDRQMVGKILQRRIQREIQAVEKFTTGEINNNLAHSKNAAVVAEGNKLKDDLKAFQEALQAIVDSMAKSGKDSAHQKNE